VVVVTERDAVSMTEEGNWSRRTKQSRAEQGGVESTVLAVEEEHGSRVEGEVLAKIVGAHGGQNVRPRRVLHAMDIGGGTR
jgi:hypothetical protein